MSTDNTFMDEIISIDPENTCAGKMMKNHINSLLATRNESSDISYKKGDTIFKANTFILSMHSPVFKAKFSAFFKEKDETQFTIDDKFDPIAFGKFLDMLYSCGTVTLKYTF